MNMCAKCGHEVMPTEDLFFLTMEFLRGLNINLGSPNYTHQHIFAVNTSGKECEGTPNISKILKTTPSISNLSTREDRWRQAYKVIANRN